MQTAEGALTETHSILQRMRDLAVQAANGGAQDTDAQAASYTEYTQLAAELDRISDTTQFGSQKLLDGSYNGTFQVGHLDGQTISVNLSATALDSTGLGVDTATVTWTGGTDSTANATNASAAITKIDDAIKTVSTTRANLGAVQNRFEHTINNLNVAVENLSASESRIRDTDMASEMMNFTRAQILSQAGTAMLAQANQAPQGVLRLLQ